MTCIAENALYTRYCASAATAAARIGMTMFLGSELPQILPKVGFTNVQRLEPKHPIDTSMNGQMTTGGLLGIL
jgi:hypothetical protein